MKKEYYIVWAGRVPGVYSTWPEASKQVTGYSGAMCSKGFITLQDAMKAYEDGYEKFIMEKRDRLKGGPSLF